MAIDRIDVEHWFSFPQRFADDEGLQYCQVSVP